MIGTRLAKRLSTAIQTRWYGRRPVWPLVPLALIFAVIVSIRREAYRRGWLRVYRLERPVLIVGNITVGGSGKTPLTLALLERARGLGIRVGVVSRGYGGASEYYPLFVDAETAPSMAGDEPSLIARRSGVPVVVDPDRVRAAQSLIDKEPIDLIVADDGLQHYRLGRDGEIAVVDTRRGYGNGWLLPAGPLREPSTRVDQVDLVCANGSNADFWLVPAWVYNLCDGRSCALAEFVDTPVHAVAGIGEPARFFDMLRDARLKIIEHTRADHHRYTHDELCFDDGRAVLMTEKDAVKCQHFDNERLWAVSVDTCLSAECAERVDRLLQRLINRG